MKDIKINAALPMDHRVTGYSEIQDTGGRTIFADSYSKAFQGAPLMYVDTPEGYREHHQVNSEPSIDQSFFTGDEPQTAPLTRYVPPGSESFAARDAAERKLATSKHPRRRTSWKMVGIRPEYAFSAGDWIHKVKVINPQTSTDRDYIIDAPVMTVTFDFEKQETIIGGLISEISFA